MTLEELVEKYKAEKDQLTQEELALREEEVLPLARNLPDRKEIRSGHLVADVLGAPHYDVRHRSTLRSYGEAARPLWDRLNAKQMTVMSAILVARDAKHIALGNDVNMDVAVRQALEMYDSRPYVRHVGGIPVRMGAPRVSRMPTSGKRKSIRGMPKPVASAETTIVSKIRSDISEYLDSKLKNVEPAIKEQLLNETSVEVRIMLKDLDNKLRRFLETFEDVAKANEAITRRDVVDACHTLHMDPPRSGRPADMEMAKKQKKRLARLYHPDAHGEADAVAMREKFDAIMAAFNCLDTYNQRTMPTGKETSVNGNGNESGGRRA